MVVVTLAFWPATSAEVVVLEVATPALVEAGAVVDGVAVADPVLGYAPAGGVGLSVAPVLAEPLPVDCA
jgi:hypothetical protein